MFIVRNSAETKLLLISYLNQNLKKEEENMNSLVKEADFTEEKWLVSWMQDNKAFLIVLEREFTRFL